VTPYEAKHSAPKPAAYYGVARSELVPRLPRPLGSVLDVGCGGGATGALLREAGAERLTGIEIVPDAAEHARTIYDVVMLGPVEEELPRLEGPFDTILAYDVLEHLVDPWQVLEDLRGLAAPGATLHVSMPNARHASLTLDLVVRGTFAYRESGHRDSTHLRWFTRRDLLAALRGAGWIPEDVVGHVPIPPWQEALTRWSRGHLGEFLVLQWEVLARCDPAGP
jgi:2-polyprenyl-3-methyl-5-hydroxy-6-metoxy-1,4-benzoquinol methylase